MWPFLEFIFITVFGLVILSSIATISFAFIKWIISEIKRKPNENSSDDAKQ